MTAVRTLRERGEEREVKREGERARARGAIRVLKAAALRMSILPAVHHHGGLVALGGEGRAVTRALFLYCLAFALLHRMHPPIGHVGCDRLGFGRLQRARAASALHANRGKAARREHSTQASSALYASRGKAARLEHSIGIAGVRTRRSRSSGL